MNQEDHQHSSEIRSSGSTLDINSISELLVRPIPSAGIVVLERNDLNDDSPKYTRRIQMSPPVMGISEFAEPDIRKDARLFSEYDEWVESKYNLDSGGSFKARYEQLKSIPSPTAQIDADCYRVLRLIRNAIEHSKRNVKLLQESDKPGEESAGGYAISYVLNTKESKKRKESKQSKKVNEAESKPIELRVTAKGLDAMRALVVSRMLNRIFGLYLPYVTRGHYMGMLLSLHMTMIGGIKRLQDDLTATSMAGPGTEGLIRFGERCIARDAQVAKNEETCIVLERLPGVTDYVYNGHLLPVELEETLPKVQTTKTGLDGNGSSTITFSKRLLTADWKMPAATSAQTADLRSEMPNQ